MIYREEKVGSYLCLDKVALQDESLTIKAKGLHSYLMSLPDDWKIYAIELCSHSQDGKTTIVQAIKELEEAGYIHKYRIQSGWEYDIYENKKSNKYRKPHMLNPTLIGNHTC